MRLRGDPGVKVTGSCKGKVSSRRLLDGNVAVVTWRGRETEGGVVIFFMTCEKELEELSSGLKGPALDGTGIDWRRDVGVGMEEIDIRFIAGDITGAWVVLGERVEPLGFRVLSLALLSLLSREAVERPLVLVLTEGEVTDTREVEVLRDTLVDASDGVTFFVFAIVR